jgi:hypothetical protein
MARTPSGVSGVGIVSDANSNSPGNDVTERSAARAATRYAALFDLGIGLWLTNPAAKTYAGELKVRGKPGGMIACALAHRVTRIACALVRDHATYNPSRWT